MKVPESYRGREQAFVKHHLLKTYLDETSSPDAVTAARNGKFYDLRMQILEWVLNIKSQCDAQKIAFFFKQWGSWGDDGKRRAKKHNGRFLNGRTWDAVPLQPTSLKTLIPKG